MKWLLILVSALLVIPANGQRLRDSLFAGKLKVDTGRTVASKDTGKYEALKNDPTAIRIVEKKPVSSPVSAQEKPGKPMKAEKPEAAPAPVAEAVPAGLTMPDSLNKQFYARQKQWKRFIDVNVPILTQQAGDTKKVKKGSYDITIEYEIGLNGRITTRSVTSSPANDYLVEQVNELMKRAPVLSPPVYSDGKPRAMAASQMITVVKK